MNYDYVSAKYYTITATMNDPGEASESRESRKAKAAEVLARYYRHVVKGESTPEELSTTAMRPAENPTSPPPKRHVTKSDKQFRGEQLTKHVHDELLNAKFEIGRLSNQVESLSAQVERFQETNSVLNAKIIRLERELIEEQKKMAVLESTTEQAKKYQNFLEKTVTGFTPNRSGAE